MSVRGGGRGIGVAVGSGMMGWAAAVQHLWHTHPLGGHTQLRSKRAAPSKHCNAGRRVRPVKLGTGSGGSFPTVAVPRWGFTPSQALPEPPAAAKSMDAATTSIDPTIKSTWLLLGS